MFDMTTTAMTVHDMRFKEELAQAERYHTLVRGEKVVGKAPVMLRANRLPRISLVSRLIHPRLRPA